MKRIYVDYDQEKTIENITNSMKEKAYTVKDIAFVLEVSISTIYNWFNGINYVSAINQRKLALVLEKSVEELFVLKEEFVNECICRIKRID